MNTRNFILAIVTGIAIVLLVIGIILMSDSNNYNTDRIRIAHFPNIGHVVPIVGIKNGFFEETVGVNVEINTKIFDSGPQVIESMFANSIDLAYVGPGPAINGFLNSDDNNIKILAGAASGGSSFIVHPDSKIINATDFVGKKIATPHIGNTQDVSLRNYLSENGLITAEKGGNVIVYNIPNPDIYTLFVKGEIDGAWVAEPWATILEKKLDGNRLFHEEELWPDNEFASVLLIGNTNYIENNPQIISNFLIAHQETINWINENYQETGDIFNNFLDSYLGQSLPDNVVDVALSNLVITSDPLPSSIHSFAEQAYALGYLGRDEYDISEIFYYHDSNFSTGGQ